MNTSNNTPKEIVYSFTVSTCQLIFLTEKIECSESNHSLCITCPVFGSFLSGDIPSDNDGPGHYICLLLWALTTLVGTFGTLANILIILILGHQKEKRSFNIFLMGLAGFDALCSISTVCTATATVLYLQNWSRDYWTVIVFLGGLNIVLIARSASSFATVLITVERFLVVAFPIKLGNWFTHKRNRVLIISVAIWGFLLGMPRIMSFYVAENNLGYNFSSLHGVDYFITATSLEKYWYGSFGNFHDLIDFWVPLPVLLIFNSLLYHNVRKFEARRTELNVKLQRDIRAARMFLPVVALLFICNIVPFVHYALLYGGNIYGETELATMLSFTINSAVNLPIYYLKGSSFRKETKLLFSSYFPCCTTQEHSLKRASKITSSTA